MESLVKCTKIGRRPAKTQVSGAEPRADLSQVRQASTEQERHLERSRRREVAQSEGLGQFRESLRVRQNALISDSQHNSGRGVPGPVEEEVHCPRESNHFGRLIVG